MSRLRRNRSIAGEPPSKCGMLRGRGASWAARIASMSGYAAGSTESVMVADVLAGRRHEMQLCRPKVASIATRGKDARALRTDGVARRSRDSSEREPLMSWFASLLVALLTAAIGLVLGGFIASNAVSWYRI